jgi:hypothetical protein
VLSHSSANVHAIASDAVVVCLTHERSNENVVSD